jgi:hypothetical protein
MNVFKGWIAEFVRDHIVYLNLVIPMDDRGKVHDLVAIFFVFTVIDDLARRSLKNIIAVICLFPLARDSPCHGI